MDGWSHLSRLAQSPPSSGTRLHFGQGKVYTDFSLAEVENRNCGQVHAAPYSVHHCSGHHFPIWIVCWLGQDFVPMCWLPTVTALGQSKTAHFSPPRKQPQSFNLATPKIVALLQPSKTATNKQFVSCPTLSACSSEAAFRTRHRTW